MKVQYVYFKARETAVFEETELDESLKGSEILVKSDYDVISAGTELANYHDLPNTSCFRDVQGEFPRYPGYSVSGHVLAAGPDAQFKAGDKVVVPWMGHRSIVKNVSEKFLKLPDDADMKVAAFTHLSSFPMLGVRKLQIQLGESCMVAGLGLLGLLSVQFAKLSGAYPVLACDFSPERRELAKTMGADFVFDPRNKDFMDQVKAATGGKGPECVVEVTGYLSGLQQALEYVAFMGRISLLGCTRISDQPINVYRYIHGKGVELLGAHTLTRAKQESRPGYWTEKDDYRTFIKLVQAQKLQIAPLIGRVVSPRDCAEVYRTLGFEKNPPLGMLFDWTSI